MGEAVREPLPHEIQVGNCDESGFRTNHGRGWYATTCTRPALGCAARDGCHAGADIPARRGSEVESSDSEEEVDRPTPRRSGQEKRFPDRYGL